MSRGRPPALDRLDGAPRLRARARGSRLFRGLGVLAAAAAVATTAAGWAAPAEQARAARNPAPLTSALPAAPSVNRFLPPLVRLLPAVVPAATGPHTFLEQFADGRPVRYDPCRALHFVVNPDEAPANWRVVVDASIAAVRAATGLEFVDDGETAEVPSDQRHVATASGWAPLLISWRTAAQDPDLAGDVVGVSGSDPSGDVSTDPDTHYVSGQVVLDSVAFRQLAARGRRADEQAVTMHELGHVVGLGHVQDRHELMNPEYLGLHAWGPGDLAGLAELGAGPCYREG